MMNAANDSTPANEDANLLVMAREPETELTVDGRQVAGLKPWIVLLAFVPSLLAFRHFAPDDVVSEEGLRAWQLVASGSIDNANNSITPLNGLMAMCLRLELLSPETRLLIVSYFGSVVLLLSLAKLVETTCGVRAALIAVLLASFHPMMLGMSGTLPMTTLAVAFALLVSCGMVRHQQSTRWLTWGLMGSGLAWGLSRLISDSFTLATGGLLLVQAMIPVRAPEASAIRSLGWQMRLLRSLWSVLAVTSVMILTVIAWDAALLMPIEHRTEWLSRFTASWREMVALNSHRSWSFTEFCRATLTTTGLLLGFTLLGLADFVQAACRREWHRLTDGSWFLTAWWGLATALVVLTWPLHRGEFGDSAGQPLYWLMANIALGAAGVNAIIRRAFGFEVVFWATAWGLVGGFISPDSVSRVGLDRGGWWIALTVGLGVILGISWWLRRVNWSAGTQRRWLFSCLVVTGVANVAWGLFSLPTPATDEHELRALRRQLGTEHVSERPTVLVSERQPPPRLLFFLNSFNPNVPVRVVAEWESGAKESSKGSELPELIFSWGRLHSQPIDAARGGRRLIPVSSLHYFQGQPLRAYRWTWRTVGHRKESATPKDAGLAGRP